MYLQPPASLKSLTHLLFVSAWRVHQDRWDRRGTRGLRDPRWASELGHCSMLCTSSSSHFFLFILIQYVSQGIRGVEGNIGAPGITGARVRRKLYNGIIFKFIFPQQVKIWISATCWLLILNLKCKKKQQGNQLFRFFLYMKLFTLKLAVERTERTLKPAEIDH